MRGVATDPSKRPGDILVIDDDAILRDLVTDWLEARGLPRAPRGQLLRRDEPSWARIRRP